MENLKYFSLNRAAKNAVAFMQDVEPDFNVELHVEKLLQAEIDHLARLTDEDETAGIE